MAQFQAFEPNIEVNGETILSVIDGMGTFKDVAYLILKKNQIDNPEAGKWYMQQFWLNAFRDISERFGANTLFHIGKKIPENANFPAQINSVESALASIDVAYHMNHRGGEIGHYAYTQNGACSAVVECNNPYPCDFDRGIVYAMVTRFAPPGRTVNVTHDDNRPCRKKGADSCTYLIVW